MKKIVVGGVLKKVAFYTLGCKVNQYETEGLIELFQNNKYEIVEFQQPADIYVINTCTVTNMSDKKSKQAIRRAKTINNNSLIIVIGCFAQTSPDEVKNIPGVNLVIGTKDRNKILEYIDTLDSTEKNISIVQDISKNRIFEELNVNQYKERTRAFLKIQDGCNQFCSYCIIPYARGPIRSREPLSIINEVKSLSKNGYKEVVLTGIHLASYGKDLKTISLLEIIKNIDAIDEIERIRISSLEPTIINNDFIELFKSSNKLCRHLHISLQSGCDETLKRMNRRYTTKEYKEGIELLNQNVPDIAISTDVMVGFPGETDEEFKKTYDFLNAISLKTMHVFKYSRRKGTPAADFEGQVSPQKKQQRSEIVCKLSKQNNYDFNEKYIGKNLLVLFEQMFDEKQDLIEGLTTNYIRVVCRGDISNKGKILNVKLIQNKGDYVLGEILC